MQSLQSSVGEFKNLTYLDETSEITYLKYKKNTIFVIRIRMNNIFFTNLNVKCTIKSKKGPKPSPCQIHMLGGYNKLTMHSSFHHCAHSGALHLQISQLVFYLIIPVDP
jgi:hypothetical protein